MTIQRRRRRSATRYLKGVVEGIAGFLLTVILVAVFEAVFSLGLAGPYGENGELYLAQWAGLRLLITGAAGFALGYRWKLRRPSRRALICRQDVRWPVADDPQGRDAASPFAEPALGSWSAGDTRAQDQLFSRAPSSGYGAG